MSLKHDETMTSHLDLGVTVRALTGEMDLRGSL